VDARTLTVKEVFAKDIRYLIPMYQRPYVWNEQTHWEPLWEDVRLTAERYLRNLRREDCADPVQAEQQTAPHFLGAIVVDQIAFGVGDVEARHVIDGQQRLTTLQLLLDAAQEVFVDVAPGREARLLRKLVLNDPDVAVRPDHQFKVWPTNVDRAAFRAAMHNEVDATPYKGTPIADGHAFFKLQVAEWLQAAANDAEHADRVSALNVVLHTRLQLVVIDLEPHDNPQVIFETLNARGTPLLASDLVKNHLLQTAESRGIDAESLYEAKWQRFDQPNWRKEQQQGRLRRPRIDTFLDYWLELRTLDEVAAHDVFPAFRAYLAAQADLEATIDDLQKISDVYDRLTDPPPSMPVTFLRRWQEMEAQVATPVLLWIFSKAEVMGPDQVRVATAALESFLVRRMICRLTTKDYNRLFLDALEDLEAGDIIDAGERFHSFLARQTSDARYWPPDSEFALAAVNGPLYRWLKRSRLRIILEALENALRTERSEEPFSPSSKVTIEHLIPQAWSGATWPLDDPQLANRRSQLLHSLGNLTLVNDKLNPSLSNGSWAEKRSGLAQHSVLRLNHQILADPAPWSDDRVVARGKDLARRMIFLWPGPKEEGVDFDELAGSLPPGTALRARADAAPPPATTISRLLDAGLLEPGDLLIWRRPQAGVVHEAWVTAAGQIETGDGELSNSPSEAAVHLCGSQTNGWKAWRVTRLDDVLLSDLRDELD
jgi:hypothetical protein